MEWFLAFHYTKTVSLLPAPQMQLGQSALLTVNQKGHGEYRTSAFFLLVYIYDLLDSI